MTAAFPTIQIDGCLRNVLISKHGKSDKNESEDYIETRGIFSDMNLSTDNVSKRLSYVVGGIVRMQW